MSQANKKSRGIFNKYSTKMPFVERLNKDINYFNLATINFFKNKFENRTLLVYPEYPSRRSTIYRVAKKLGYNVTNKIGPNVKHAIYWENTTIRKEYQYLEELSKKMNVINLHNRDIGKKYIDKIHQEVFNYSTVIDPSTYTGKIVRKSDLNAKHDGQILDSPIDNFDEESIYQILIDNSFSSNLVVDIRVPVVGVVLDFVYIKYRDISERFKNTTTKTEMKSTDEIFSQEEIILLNQYCKKLNFEYGELDVLRNKNDNKIYTVDVNNTPMGPPANISKKDGTTAMKKIGIALEKYMEGHK